MTADEEDHEQMERHADFIFVALKENFTPRAMGIMRAAMRTADRTSQDYMAARKTIDEYIEAFIKESDNPQLVVPSLMMVLAERLEKLLGMMLSASSQSEITKNAIFEFVHSLEHPLELTQENINEIFGDPSGVYLLCPKETHNPPEYIEIGTGSIKNGLRQYVGKHKPMPFFTYCESTNPEQVKTDLLKVFHKQFSFS